MKNTKNAIIYGVVSGGVGFGVSKLFKAGPKATIGIIAAMVVAGAYFGNKS